MRTLGIDLAAQPSDTAACWIDWDTCAVEVLTRHRTDEDLVGAIVSADRCAIDIPLGWPDEFVDALVAHRDADEWPAMDPDVDAERERLKYRHTDRAVRAAGALPLSVAADRIAVAAMRGARIQQLLVSRGCVVDRSGLTGVVVEAYPAAALRSWGFNPRGYKGSKPVAVDVRAQLVAEFLDVCGVIGEAARGGLEGCRDDEFDAFICALIARAALDGHTSVPGSDRVAQARREGWIHLPTVGLAELCDAHPAAPLSQA